MRRCLPILLASCLVAFPAAAKDTKVASWNMGWLTLRAAEINGPTPDPKRAIYQRNEQDFETLRAYVRQLGADVIALQEVDTVEAAAKVFDPSEYTVILGDETDYQRAGWAIRKSIRYTRMPDLASLDLLDGQPRSLRKGVDVVLHLPSGDVRALAVHLKSGCFSPRSNNDACPVITEQMPILAKWIDQRQAEKVSMLVAGDFNRRLNREDPLWQVLDNGRTPTVKAALYGLLEALIFALRVIARTQTSSKRHVLPACGISDGHGASPVLQPGREGSACG